MAHGEGNFSNWTQPIEIPSLETTDAADRQQEEAFNSL